MKPEIYAMKDLAAALGLDGDKPVTYVDEKGGICSSYDVKGSVLDALTINESLFEDKLNVKFGELDDIQSDPRLKMALKQFLLASPGYKPSLYDDIDDVPDPVLQKDLKQLLADKNRNFQYAHCVACNSLIKAILGNEKDRYCLNIVYNVVKSIGAMKVANMICGVLFAEDVIKLYHGKVLVKGFDPNFGRPCDYIFGLPKSLNEYARRMELLCYYTIAVSKDSEGNIIAIDGRPIKADRNHISRFVRYELAEKEPEDLVEDFTKVLNKAADFFKYKEIREDCAAVLRKKLAELDLL